MTDSKWYDLADMLEAKYPELERYEEDIEDAQGTKEVLEFKSPAGMMRVVRESKPVLLDKTFHYSHRPGDTARTEYTFSDSEFSHKVRVYRETGDGWEELSVDSMSF